MVVPLFSENLKILVNLWQVNIMQCPQVSLIGTVNDVFIFKKSEKLVVHICHNPPEISPKSLNPLVMDTLALDGTSSKPR